MRATERTEARIIDANNALVAPPDAEGEGLIGDFCGSAITTDDLSSGSPDLARKTVYLCGDVSRVDGPALDAAERVFVIRELSRGYGEGNNGKAWSLVDRGRVPVRVHGVGVYYRRFFDPGFDHFNRIRAEHEFQSLTESTKPGTAHRTGIYLTPVERDDDGLHFRLLRCSTNLSGPTDNFRATDRLIVDALNREAAVIFENPPRTLLVESKGAGVESDAIPLAHNSAVVFSVGANRRLRHKIVLAASARMPENRWLGVTFRTSKTFMRFRDGGAYFPDGVRLALADDEQRREFYSLRRRENDDTDFTYPRLTYTVSESDLVSPEPTGDSPSPPSDHGRG